MSGEGPQIESNQIDWRDALSESLTPSELARLFNVSSRSVTRHMEGVPGAVRRGRNWQIPLGEMPATYLIRIGLLRAGSLN